MSNKSDNLIAFILGAAAGAAAGLLLAPDSGANTRKKLKTKFADLQERGGELYENVEQKMKDRTEAVKTAIHEGKAAYLREVNKT